MDFKSLLVTCSVHPEILRALHFKTNHPSWSSAWSDKRLCQTTGLAAGGDAGESADKCRTACGLSSQHSSRTVADSSWYMHVKSGLLQLWEVTTCSKGYTTRLLFPSISTAHLIHGQVYSATENSNSENLFKLSQIVSQTDWQNSSSSSGLRVHCLNYPSSLPFPTPLIFSLPFLLCAWLTRFPSPHMSYTLPNQNFNTMLPLPLPQHFSLDPYFPVFLLQDEDPEVLWSSESAAEGAQEKIQQFPTHFHCDIVQKLQGNTHILYNPSVMLFWSYTMQWDPLAGFNFTWGFPTRKLKAYWGERLMSGRE